PPGPGPVRGPRRAPRWRRPVGRDRRRRARAHAPRARALRPLRHLQRRPVRGVTDPKLIEDCVHCGFCLPTCPTYVLWGEEMDSPRGRILLMRAGHEEEGPMSAVQVQAWDNCLGCMACVTACPSGVKYDKLIEDTRGQVERRWERPRMERLRRHAIFAAFPHPERLRWIAPFAPLARPTARFLGRFPHLQVLARLAPPRPVRAKIPELTPAAGARRGRVGFLQGCIQRVFFGNVNAA